MSDNVEHPSHYTRYRVEVIELTRDMPFLEANCVKYLCRAPYKGNELEDLKKARQYLEWAIDDAESRLWGEIPMRCWDPKHNNPSKEEQ